MKRLYSENFWVFLLINIVGFLLVISIFAFYLSGNNTDMPLYYEIFDTLFPGTWVFSERALGKPFYEILLGILIFIGFILKQKKESIVENFGNWKVTKKQFVISILAVIFSLIFVFYII